LPFLVEVRHDNSMHNKTWLAARGTAAGGIHHRGGYRQVVDGVAVYFGVMPAELVRGHPREHPESEMHSGVPAGENHLVIALFNDKTGERITRAEITATITGPDRFKAEKKLESMLVAGAATFGNYFTMPGPGPYRIACVFERRVSGMTTRRRSLGHARECQED